MVRIASTNIIPDNTTQFFLLSPLINIFLDVAWYTELDDKEGQHRRTPKFVVSIVDQNNVFAVEK